MLAPKPSRHLESENLAPGNPLYRFNLSESCSSLLGSESMKILMRISPASLKAMQP